VKKAVPVSHNVVRLRRKQVEDLQTANPEQYAALMAMLPVVEGKPVVHVSGTDGTVFVCRRIHGLHVAADEWTFYGECDWADPPEARPDELTDGMAISCGDCLQLGHGWWYDAYFDWFFVYEPSLVARSLAGDHSWVKPFLDGFQPPEE
jgi:hypothetical protein